MMVTDLVLNNLVYPTGEFIFMYSGSLFTYMGFAAYSLMGYLSKSRKSAALGLIAGSIIFFAVFKLWGMVQCFQPLSKNRNGTTSSVYCSNPVLCT